MKKTITILAAIILLSIEGVLAQAPQSFKYQAIARDNSGNILANQNVSFRISILQGSTSGPSVYTETQTATTNQFGLANLNIGMGTLVSGNFSTISWGGNTYFVKMEFDPTGASSFILMGTSQLLSVPYALYSENTGDTSMWQKNGSNLFYNNGKIGIGTNSPTQKLHVIGNIMSENGGFISKTTSAGTPIYQLDKGGILWETGLNSGGDFYIGNSISQKVTISNSTGNVGIKSGQALEIYNATNTNWASFYMNTGGTKLIENYTLEVNNGDVYVSNLAKGVILVSPNGTCYRVTVGNTGTLVSTAITCP